MWGCLSMGSGWGALGVGSAKSSSDGSRARHLRHTLESQPGATGREITRGDVLLAAALDHAPGPSSGAVAASVYRQHRKTMSEVAQVTA